MIRQGFILLVSLMLLSMSACSGNTNSNSANLGADVNVLPSDIQSDICRGYDLLLEFDHPPYVDIDKCKVTDTLQIHLSDADKANGIEARWCLARTFIYRTSKASSYEATVSALGGNVDYTWHDGKDVKVYTKKGGKPQVTQMTNDENCHQYK